MGSEDYIVQWFYFLGKENTREEKYYSLPNELGVVEQELEYSLLTSRPGCFYLMPWAYGSVLSSSSIFFNSMPFSLKPQ